MYKMGVVRNVVLVALLILLLGAGCYGPVRTATIGKREFATETWFEANHPYLMPITVPAGALYDTVVFSLDTTFMLTANMVWRPMFETYPEPLKPEWPALAAYAISPLAVSATPLILLDPIPLLDKKSSWSPSDGIGSRLFRSIVGAPLFYFAVGVLPEIYFSDEYKEEREQRLKLAGQCLGTLPIIGLPYHGYRIAETWDKYERVFGRHRPGPTWEQRKETEIAEQNRRLEIFFRTKLRHALSFSDKCKLLLESKETFEHKSWWTEEKAWVRHEIEKKIVPLREVCSYEEAQQKWSALSVDPTMEAIALCKPLFEDWDLLPLTFESFPWGETIKTNLLKKWSALEPVLSCATSLEEFKEILWKNDYQMIIKQGEQYGIDVNQMKEEVESYQLIAELKEAIDVGNSQRVEEICEEKTRIKKTVNVDSLVEKIVDLNPETINSLLANNWLNNSTLSNFFESNHALKGSQVKSLLVYAFIENGKSLLAETVLNASRLKRPLSDFDEDDSNELVKFLLLKEKIVVGGVWDLRIARERWGDKGIDEIVFVLQLNSGRIVIREGRAMTSDRAALSDMDDTYRHIIMLWNDDNRTRSDIQNVILIENMGEYEWRLADAKRLGDACRKKGYFKEAQEWYWKCWKEATGENEESPWVIDAKTELIKLYCEGQIYLEYDDALILYPYHPAQKGYEKTVEIAEVLYRVLQEKASLSDKAVAHWLKCTMVTKAADKEKKDQVISSLWALMYQFKPDFFVENYGNKKSRFRGELFLDANPNNYVGLATCCLLYGEIEKIKISANAVKTRFPNKKQDDKPEPVVSYHLWLTDAYKLHRLLGGFKTVVDQAKQDGEDFYKALIKQKDNHDTEPIDYLYEKVFKEQKWGVDSFSIFKDLDVDSKERILKRVDESYPQHSKKVGEVFFRN